MMWILGFTPAPVARALRRDAPAARLLRPVLNRALPQDPVAVTVRSGLAKGIKLPILPRSEKYYWTGTHELAVQGVLLSILKPGMVFWDVGAHIGFYSLLASRLVGSSGRVHAFEPMDANRKRLYSSVELNRASNVTVHADALADSAGERELYAHHSSTMWTLVSELGEGDGLTVRCETMDRLARNYGLPDVIKIDAEGAEFDVLRGGEHLLSTTRPTLLVEFSNQEMVERARQALDRYRFEQVDPRHWLLQA